ncbi:MAG: hypothetical protein ACKO9A_16820 [Alphaproteobacteria bacterium]
MASTFTFTLARRFRSIEAWDLRRLWLVRQRACEIQGGAQGKNILRHEIKGHAAGIKDAIGDQDPGARPVQGSEVSAAEMREMRRAVTVIRQGQRSRKPERCQRIGVILSVPGISVRAPPAAERDKLNQTLAAHFLKRCRLKFAQFNSHCSLILRCRIEVKAKITEGCSAADFALGKTPDFKRWDGFFPKSCQMMVRRRNIIWDYPTQCSDAVLILGNAALPDTRTGPYASRQAAICAAGTGLPRRQPFIGFCHNRCPGALIKPQPILFLPAEMLRKKLPWGRGDPHRIEIARPGDK